MIYKYRPGTYVTGVAAEIAGPALLSIREKYGMLTTRQVVDEAKSPRHPLHPAFEWNDTKAADSWRKVQARNLIKAVVVVDDRPESVPTRLFVNITDSEEGPHYETLSVAYQDAMLREQVLDRALLEEKVNNPLKVG